MGFAHGLELVCEVALGVQNVLHHSLVTHSGHVGNSHCGGHRMAPEGGTVHIRANGGVEDLVDQRAPDDHATQGLVGRRDAFGEGNHVGHHTVALAGEPVTEPAERADDLVGHQQHAVTVADAAEFLPVPVGRDQGATTVLDRLGDNHGNRLWALGQDGLFDGLHTGQLGDRGAGR